MTALAQYYMWTGGEVMERSRPRPLRLEEVSVAVGGLGVINVGVIA